MNKILIYVGIDSCAIIKNMLGEKKMAQLDWLKKKL